LVAFDADEVPVGKDQKQHLEICQELCRKVNDRYGEGTLHRPEALIDERAEARKSRNFSRADEIRDELAAAGIVLEDKSGETRWRRS
ncbi:MAG: cysteine--tRNA ligase, partial [Myxococcota bacterium]